MIFNLHFTKAKKIIFILFTVVLTSVFFAGPTVKADNPEDTKTKMEEKEQEKEEKKAELASAKTQLTNTQNSLKQLEYTKNTYEGKLNNLNGELQLVADNLAVIEAELELKQLELDETSRALEEAIIRCEDQYAAMKERIRFMYESGDTMYLELLFSAQTFGEMLNYADYVEALSAYDRMMLEEYVQTQQDVADAKVLREEELNAIEELKASAIEEQERVTELISETSNSLAATADSIEDMEDMEEAYKAECDRKAQEVAIAEAEYEAIKKQYEEEVRLSKLAKQSSWREISQVSFEEGDRYLLANLIYCEAGNQSYEGQVGVGAVVMNRVMSSRYPDTITGVIYQHKQFSPVNDGHLALALANNRATESCYAAADAAMSGTTTVGNCLYFRTPIEGLQGLQIGNHIFY